MTHVARAEQLVAAPPERVWRALTSAELADWFWPARFQTEAVVEAWPGGRFRVASVPMGMGVTGVVTAVEEPHRLALTWRWDGETLETDVAIELEEAVEGTTVRVVHAGFPDAHAAQEHAQGWSDCMGRLAELFAAEG